MSGFQIQKSSGITPVAFFQIQVEFGGHLGFMKISNFRLIHTKCHVIPHFWIFWGKLIHFWCYFGDLTHILQNMVPQGVKYPNFSQNDPKYWYYANNFPIWTIR